MAATLFTIVSDRVDERAAFAAMHGHSGQGRPGGPVEEAATPCVSDATRGIKQPSIQSMNLLPLRCLWHTPAGN